MYNPQPPLQTGNACDEDIINDKVKQRRSKVIDMRFYWVRDRVRQGHFRIHWKKEQTIAQTILPNIICLPITDKCVQSTSMNHSRLSPTLLLHL
jgi:hypothetical protein